MIRKSLVRHPAKVNPDYKTLSDMFKSDSKRSLKTNLDSILSPSLRFFVAAFRKNLKDMPEDLYNAIRNDTQKFQEFLDKYLQDNCRNAPVQKFKYWVGYDDNVVKNFQDVADKFFTYLQDVQRSAKYVSNVIMSTKFLRDASSVMNTNMPVKNTTNYERVKEKLLRYHKESARRFISGTESEKERIMLLLYRQTPEKFTQNDYDYLVKNKNAFNLIDIEIRNLLPEDYAMAVEAFLGVGRDPVTAQEAANMYNISKSTVCRKTNYVMNELTPQLILK